MEDNRCAQCRKAIRGRQAVVRLARADMSFHGDCWVILTLNVQQEYELRAQDEGLAALLGPYNRSETGSWLPTDDAADEADEVAEDVQLSAVSDTGLAHELPPAVAS